MCTKKFGGRMLYYGDRSTRFPVLFASDQHFDGYDALALMEYESAGAMLAMLTSEDYQAVSRVAGLKYQTWSAFQRDSDVPQCE